jgi:hypothetical protein
MKQQSVVTHTIRKTDISPLPDNWVANTPSVKMLCPQKEELLLLIFSKKQKQNMFKYRSIDDLSSVVCRL